MMILIISIPYNIIIIINDIIVIIKNKITIMIIIKIINYDDHINKNNNDI